MPIPSSKLISVVLFSILLVACAPVGQSPAPAPKTDAKPVVQPAASSAAGDAAKSSGLAAIVDAANKEGMVVWADNGKAETIVELNKHFNQFFGTSITVEQVPLA